MAFCCAENVVDATGQPWPGPFRFCRVTAAALRRASCEFVELSSGKVSLTVGLLMTKPAATFALISWTKSECQPDTRVVRIGVSIRQ